MEQQEAGASPHAEESNPGPSPPRMTRSAHVGWTSQTPASASAHIVDMLGFCGHYIHIHGGGRSGRAPIICALLKHGDAMPQRELMNMFDLKAGSLSEVLAKIERDGLIERTRDPQDRRQLIVRLTEEGHAQAALEQQAREEFRAQALTCFSVDERTQFEDMLARVVAHWKEIEPDMKGDCACSKN